MCYPNAWGMGFKDLSVFNDALLDRQAWRLVHGDNTSLGKVMKAKYSPNCSFLDHFWDLLVVSLEKSLGVRKF